MSKPVKALIKNELEKRFEGITSLAVVGITGIDGVRNHEIRGRLLAKDIRLTVVKNSIARQAFREIGLSPAAEMLDGPCAVAYGADSVVTVVRELLDIKRETPNLTVKAALLEGEIFGADRIAELSALPTLGEALSGIVRCVLSPGAKLAGCLVGPGGKIASLVKAIEDKQKDEGGADEAPASVSA